MKKLLATLATLTLLACSAQAQSTNQVGFLFSISEDSMRTITNAWRTHQAAVRLDRTNYGGYAVERVLTVTNEATGQGFFTNGIPMTGLNGPSTLIRARFVLLSTSGATDVLQFDVHARHGGAPVTYAP